MNTKGIKFLAVLAVLAMAFAAFAVAIPAEQYDATAAYDSKLGEFEISNSTAAAEKLDLELKGQTSLTGVSTSQGTTVTGYTTNEKVDSAYTKQKYSGSAVLKLCFPAMSSGYSSIYGISIAQKSNAIGDLVQADMNSHQVLDLNNKTMTSWFAKSTFNTANDFEMLIPQDGSGITLTVTIYGSDFNLSAKTGTSIGSAQYTITLTGVTTVVDLQADADVQSLKGNVSGGWAYTNSDDTLNLNAFKGNVAFEGKITYVLLTGESELKINTSDSTNGGKIIGSSINNSAIGSNQTLTIKSSSTNKATLVIKQSGTGNAICGTGAVNIGSDTSTGVTAITATAGALGIYSGGAMTIANSEITSTASEKAIRCGSFSTTTSTITAKIDSKGITNNAGNDDIWGIKASSTFANTSSIITTQGLRVGTTVTSEAGYPVYVTGDYTTNADAGLHLDAATNTVQLAEATPGTAALANIVYVQKDAAVFAPSATIKDVSGTDIGVKATDKDDIQAKLADTTKNYKVVGFADGGTAATITAGKEPTVGDAQKLEINATGGLSGTIYVGTTDKLPVTLTGVQGQFTISKGSIYIDGVLKAGTISLAGDAKLRGTVDGTVTITSSLTAVPTLTILDLAVEKDKTITFDKVSIITSQDIDNAGDIKIGEDATFASQAKIVNTTDGEVYGVFNGSNVTLASSATDGKITIANDHAITVNGKLTIPEGVELDVSALDGEKMTISEGGVLYVYGKLTGPADVLNNGTIMIMSKDATIPASISGTGTIDTSAVSSDYNISGEFRSDAAFGIYQNVNIIGDTNMVKGSLMIINGTMNVAAGVTLTIEDGAMLIINNSYGKLNNLGTIEVRSTLVASTALILNPVGTVDTFSEEITALTGIVAATADTFNAGFIVYNATVANEGTIDLAWTTTGTDAKQSMILFSNATVNNEGLFNVNNLNKITIDSGKINNLEDGMFNMEGTVADLAVNNAGSVTIDGIATGTITVHQVADEASVAVSSIKGALTVDDAGLKYAYPIANATNSIKVTSTGYALSGLKFDSAVTYSSSDEKYYKNIYINGKISIDSSATATLALGSTKYVKVTENLELPDEITLTGDLSVSGNMILEDGSKYTTGTLSVSGIVEAGKAQIAATVKATYFVTGTADKVYHYTTLPAAVEMAVLAEVNKIYVVGDNSVSKNVTIPSGMTVEQNGKLTIGSATKTGIVMEVEDGAKINSNAAIDVKATLLIDNKGTGITKSADITSEIVVEDSTSIMYTNFVTAMGFEYYEPTTITLSNAVTIKSNVTIPAMVTVDTNTKKVTVEGAKLTIDGTLFLNNSDYEVKDVAGTVPKVGSVVVNGFIKSTNTTTYDGKAYPAGAYYTVVDKGAYNMITSIARSPAVIDVAEDKSIRIFGSDLALGTLEYEGEALDLAMISIEGSVASGAVALEFAQLSILSDLEISFTVAGTDGSITFTGEKTSAKTVLIDAYNADVEEVFAMTAGTLVDGTIGTTHEITIVGAVGLADVTLNDTTIVGAVEAASSVAFTEDLVVVGAFVVDNASKVTVAGDVFVLGSLVAAEVTEKYAAGEMDIAKALYIGGDEEDFEIAGNAIVSGDVSAKDYYVFADTTVSGEIAKYLETIVSKGYYTAFYVEGDLYGTIFSTAASEIKIAEYDATTKATKYFLIPEDLEDCVFAAWMYMEDGEYKAIEVAEGSPAVKVGKYNEVYASINYNIYKIEIYTDAGIKAVSIDGVEMFNETNNKFVSLSNLEAGTHTVSFTIKSGYQATKAGVNLYTADGTILKDLKFVVDGDAGTTKLLLNGTEQIPEPEPEPTPTPEEKSEWTVTTILLCVLVVLIAIMAVIVALRLNRN